MADQEHEYYQLQVLRYCDYCLNPVTFKLPSEEGTYSRTFMCMEGLTLCPDCWGLAFYGVDFIPSFLRAGWIETTSN